MKRNILSAISWLVLGLLVASQGVLAYQLLRLDVLPGKYLAIVLAVLGGISLVLGLLMFPKQGKYAKRNPGMARRIIAWVLALVLAWGCSFGTSALDLVYETLEALTGNTVVSDVIGVYVLADREAQELTDLAGKRFAVTEQYDWENTQKTLQAIAQTLGEELETAAYDGVFSMVDALYEGEVDALILNTAYVSILEGMEEYRSFQEQTKLVYEYAIRAENPQLPQAPVQSQAAAITQQPFVLYLSGSDTRSAILSTSRSDVNILAVVNPVSKQILLVNTPRDYYVANPAGGGSLDKLTHCGIYGVDCSMEALGNLYEVEVDYYGQLNFNGFETLIDAIGGVSVYSERAFYSGSYYFQEGYNQVGGSQALAFARERYAFADGDNARGRNQMQLITAIVQKLTSGTIITRYAEILESMEGTFVTSMTQSMISDLVKMQLNDLAAWNIQSYAVTGYGDSQTTYSAPGYYAYVMQPDMDTVYQARDLIQRVMNGETLTQADVSAE